MNKGRVRFITLGCRVNQYETQGMREALEGEGVRQDWPTGGPIDYVVINTCTVTEEADKENRYWIRRARREHPVARIVVTGCGVERDRAAIEQMPEVDLVLANHEKAGIASHLIEGCGSPAVQAGNPRHQFAPLKISRAETQTRAFIKIQDGCNHSCSFCKVVMVRGRSRSRELSDIIEETVRLRDAGYREVVIAGIQLGAYGIDLNVGARHAVPLLVDVLESLSKIQGIERLRLSSIEPTDVRPELIEALKSLPKCCPHLHIPLQSGDDEILQRMNRRYGRAFYRDLIGRLRAELPDFGLSLDVMVGFPGEEESHFHNTMELLAEVRPFKCHIFPYSRRAGTRAAGLADVSKQVRRERVNRLTGHAAFISQQERSAWTGRTVPVLIECEKNSGRDGLVQGLLPNFMKVTAEGNREHVGKVLPVELLMLEGEGFFGRI